MDQPELEALPTEQLFAEQNARRAQIRALRAEMLQFHDEITRRELIEHADRLRRDPPGTRLLGPSTDQVVTIG